MLEEFRTLHKDSLRALCIKHDWYTAGDNEAYGKLLEHAHDLENVTTANIVDIAENIKVHSDTEYDMPSICFEIAGICKSYFCALEVSTPPQHREGNEMSDERFELLREMAADLFGILKRKGLTRREGFVIMEMTRDFIHENEAATELVERALSLPLE